MYYKGWSGAAATVNDESVYGARPVITLNLDIFSYNG
jgi:hypothetical protein